MESMCCSESASMRWHRPNRALSLATWERSGSACIRNKSCWPDGAGTRHPDSAERHISTPRAGFPLAASAQHVACRIAPTSSASIRPAANWRPPRTHLLRLQASVSCAGPFFHLEAARKLSKRPAPKKVLLFPIPPCPSPPEDDSRRARCAVKKHRHQIGTTVAKRLLHLSQPYLRLSAVNRRVVGSNPT